MAPPHTGRLLAKGGIERGTPETREVRLELPSEAAEWLKPRGGRTWLRKAIMGCHNVALQVCSANGGHPGLQAGETTSRKPVSCSETGRIAGGVALYVRRLIYEDLGMPMPPQWGRKSDLVPDFIRRPQKWVEALETGAAVAKVERIQHEMDSTAAVLSGLDPTKPYAPEDERLLRSLLGRLDVLRFWMEHD